MHPILQRLGLLLEEVVICAIDTMIMMWVLSFFIGHTPPLEWVVTVFVMILIVTDMLFIIGCEGESAIFGWGG